MAVLSQTETGAADLPPVPRTRAELLADLPAPWPLTYRTVENGTLAIRRAAPVDPQVAEPALLLHGLGGSSSNWADLQAMLRDTLDAVAPDLPGHGWSPPPRDGDWSPRRTADSLAELVVQLWGGQPVHVFGNSMGGAVAVQFAGRHPELVRTLTLVSPALPKRVPRRTTVHLPVLATPGIGTKLLQRYFATDPVRRAHATLDFCFADPSVVPDFRIREAEQEVRRRDTLPYAQDAFMQSLRGLLATYLDRGPDRPWKLANRITAPTLLIYGRQDKLVDPIAAHTRAFPDSCVVLLMNCGHVAQIEAPELVVEAWRRLLPH
jgi:pimeloyl-ACP methyl ester carboxylesterase